MDIQKFLLTNMKILIIFTDSPNLWTVRNSGKGIPVKFTVKKLIYWITMITFSIIYHNTGGLHKTQLINFIKFIKKFNLRRNTRLLQGAA